MVAAGLLAPATGAEAAIFWSDAEPSIARPASPTMPQRRHKASRRVGTKDAAPAKDAAKPQGPLVIAISINRQTLKVYDANGVFAESPVSTGMRGHSTPMGVFSVIQKHKWHRSNIYSGAPMPYMQRITWSGVAMHAGVLPGYPASHGCIRMPTAFAVKMWAWTRMGARVVITPGEISPADFSHPVLVAQKPVIAPTVELQNAPIRTAKADKTSDADSKAASLELKPAVDLGSTAVKAEAATEPTKTADASGAMPQIAASATMSAIVPATERLKLDGRAQIPAANDLASETRTDLPATSSHVDATTTDAPQIEPAKRDTAAATDDETARTAARADTSKQIDTPAVSKPEAAEAAASAPASKKDQARPSEAETPAAKPDIAPAPKRSGQIAVFISRKDAKLYVRQNFTPLFDAPVTIAAGERPLGTHVFTAQADKGDPGSFRWSVVSMPAVARHAERRDEDEPGARRHKTVGAVEVRSTPEPDSPAEALDRISIPQDAVARITDALSTGGSIIVSDQGIAGGETGEGTDFIIPLR